MNETMVKFNKIKKELNRDVCNRHRKKRKTFDNCVYIETTINDSDFRIDIYKFDTHQIIDKSKVQIFGNKIETVILNKTDNYYFICDLGSKIITERTEEGIILCIDQFSSRTVPSKYHKQHAVIRSCMFMIPNNIYDYIVEVMLINGFNSEDIANIIKSISL